MYGWVGTEAHFQNTLSEQKWRKPIGCYGAGEENYGMRSRGIGISTEMDIRNHWLCSRLQLEHFRLVL